MADPFSAVVHKLTHRDNTSALIALLLGYALASFGLAAATNGSLCWVICSTSVISFLIGVLAFGYAYLFKPERLRTEELARMGMVLDWITRADVDDEHRQAAAKLLPIVMQPKEGKVLLNDPPGEDHG